MPTVSMFYGLKIMMYADEHNPPHFHAEYSGYVAEIDINELEVLEGSLPKKQLKMVLGWAVIHQDELLNNWERLVIEGTSPEPIAPLK